MSYYVPHQPNTGDRQKKIVKTELIEQITNQTIGDLFWKFGETLAEIEVLKLKANEVIDELTEINKLISVDGIPTKLKQGEK